MHTSFLRRNNWNYETVKPRSKFNYLNFKYKKKFKKYFTEEFKFKNENLIKKKILTKLNIPNLNRVIVIQQRDEFYYNSPTTRNSNINNLFETINFLLKLNYKIVRYKSKKSKSLNISSKFYKEMSINDYNDKLEQFILIKNCKLVICYQGGVLGYDYICKTPFLLINAIPLNINPLIKGNDKLIFKKFFQKSKKKYLSLSEIAKYNLHLNTQSKRLKKLNINIVENNSKEIIEAVKEMVNLKKINKYNKNKINKIFPNKFSFSYSDANISNSFIKKNIEIFR